MRARKCDSRVMEMDCEERSEGAQVLNQFRNILNEGSEVLYFKVLGIRQTELEGGVMR